MDTDIYVLQAYYNGFCSTRHQPLDQNDVPAYLTRRLQTKPQVECTIHGDICGFVVTTAKARAFPAAVVNGYIAFNNLGHTVAVRHCETDHFLAGYRFFSFSSIAEQDYFIQYLDMILDSHVSMFKRNSSDVPMGRGLGKSAMTANGIPSRRQQYAPGPLAATRGYGHESRKKGKGPWNRDSSDPHAIERLRRMAHMRGLQGSCYN